MLLALPWIAHAQSCTQSGNVRLPISMEIRSPGSGVQDLSGDGNNVYSDGMHSVLANVFEAHNVSVCDPAARSCRRTFTINLNRPVAPAPPLGAIRDGKAEFHSLWYLDTNRLMHSVQDMAVGQTVESGRTEIVVNVNGARHVLLFGDGWPSNLCFTAPLIYGSNTPASITRLSATEWTVQSSNAPTGSVGKLTDVSNPSSPVEKGFYYFNFSVYIKLKSKK